MLTYGIAAAVVVMLIVALVGMSYPDPEDLDGQSWPD